MAYSVKTGPFPEPRENLRRAIESLRPRWGLIVALGILIACMGVAALALVVSATIASVYTIAVFMIVAGAAEIATGLSAKTWRGLVVWIFAGLNLYRRRGLCACAALCRGGFLYFGARRGNDRDRGCTDLPRGPFRCFAAAPRSARGGDHGAGWGIDRRGLAGESFRDPGHSPRPRSRVLGSGVDRVRVALAALLNRRSRGRPRNRQ